MANLLVSKELQNTIDIVLKRKNKSIKAYHSDNIYQSFLQTKTRQNTLRDVLIVIFERSFRHCYLWLNPSSKINCKVKHIHVTTILLQLLCKIDEILAISKFNIVVLG